MLRVHHSSTFTLEERDFKAYMSKNEGINAGADPEEDVSRNGAARLAREAALLIDSCGCGHVAAVMWLRPAPDQSGDFASGCSFLFVHCSVRTPDDLIHPFTGGMRCEADRGIDA